jgi:hypothetical protein
MPAYRCFFISNRKVAGVEILECAADQDAVERGQLLLAARNHEHARYSGIELWELARLVHIHPPAPTAATTG